MDIQHALLSKIILDEDIQFAVSAKVTTEWFWDPAYVRIYEFCLKHWRTHGAPPDKDVVARAFPSYTWTGNSQPITYWIDQLRQRRQESIVVAGFSEAAGRLQDKEDPDRIADVLRIQRETMQQIHSETANTSNRNFREQRAAIAARIDERFLNPGHLRGISTGFNGIDFVTGGLQPKQLVVLLGLPKSLKSSTLLAMAKAVRDQAQVPLFIGFEMDNDEQEDRLLALYSQVNLTNIQNGHLSMPEFEKLAKGYALLEGGVDFHFSTDMQNAMTVSGVQAMVQEYRPAVCFIDACYLMLSELPKIEQKSAQAYADIAQKLKLLAQTVEIPIVVSTQATMTRARGGKLNMFSAMWTQAWQQSADVLLGVERVNLDDTDDTGPVLTRLKVLASRSGPRAETYLDWDWSHGRVDEMDATAFATKVGADD